jgi:hypothetical protein
LRMWGKDHRDFYVCGRNGALAHYAGGFFRLNSGVLYDINDIWGVGDTALCIASNALWESSESHILRLVNGKVEEAYMKDIPIAEKALWFCKGMRQLTIVGGFYAEWVGNQWKRQNRDPLKYFKMSIRGNSPVDYFVVDQQTGVAHFNGKRWSAWKFGNENYNFLSLACTKNGVWAVGANQDGIALIVHGKRK